MIQHRLSCRFTLFRFEFQISFLIFSAHYNIVFVLMKKGKQTKHDTLDDGVKLSSRAQQHATDVSETRNFDTDNLFIIHLLHVLRVIIAQMAGILPKRQSLPSKLIQDSFRGETSGLSIRTKTSCLSSSESRGEITRISHKTKIRRRRIEPLRPHIPILKRDSRRNMGQSGHRPLPLGTRFKRNPGRTSRRNLVLRLEENRPFKIPVPDRRRGCAGKSASRYRQSRSRAERKRSC